MKKQQLTIYDDIQYMKNEEKRERSFRVNNSVLKEDGIMYNPVVHLEMSQIKKHNTLVPIRSENSKVDLRQSNSIEIQKPKLLLEMELKKAKMEEPVEAKNINKMEKSKNANTCYRKIETFLDSTAVIIILTSLTIFALFGSDIQATWLPRSVDFTFDIVQCFLLAVFTTEIILSSIAKKNYLWSFFFWLDILSTLSLIQDISFIFDYLLIGSSSLSPPIIFVYNNTTGIPQLNTVTKMNSDQAVGQIQKVSAASRATRVLRILRIVRLIRIVKLYKSAVLTREKMEKRKRLKQRMESNTNEETIHVVPSPKEININMNLITNNNQTKPIREEGLQPGDYPSPDTKREIDILNPMNLIKMKNNNSLTRNGRNSEEMAAILKKPNKQPQPNKNTIMESMINESKISKVLTESITKKVIILILVMIVILPILSDEFFLDDSLMAYTVLAEYFTNFWIINGLTFFALTNIYLPPNMIIGKYMNNSVDSNFPIVSIEMDGQLIYLNQSWVNYTFRSTEIKSAISSDGMTQVNYSNLTETTLSAGLNIGRTLFVCVCLTLAAIYFEQDTQELVLQPLEIMIEIVDSVAKDPINAKNIENLRGGVKMTIKKMGSKKENKRMTEEKYEVKVIESAIIKISALLAIGFGEAGGEIIRKNLSSTSELNPMLKGKRKTAIFGFCDIRNFPSVNELLKERTNVFVNEIAQIVHSCVDIFGGAANKNIGDAFLMVWKFKSDLEDTDSNPNQNKTTILKNQINDNLYDEDPQNPIINRTVDMALLGFLSVIIRINKDLRVLAYKNDPEIIKKLKNYKVKMGFGLHLGWAIEGAIGSSYKIDASYLSPNVNMAARLEAATKIYGVNILISGIFYNLLSDDLKNICRLVDKVKVKGSVQPVSLYTVDLNLNITPQKEIKIRNVTAKMLREKYAAKKQNILRKIKLSGSISKSILKKKSFKEILNTGRRDKFYQCWNNGLQMYFDGEWGKASKKFTECLKMVGSDGPCTTLIGFLKAHNYVAPSNWEGVRELTSKT